MWKSRVLGEISKGLWEGWKACFWLSTLSIAPSFPQLLLRSLAAPRFPQQRQLDLLHPLGRLRVAHPAGLTVEQLRGDAWLQVLLPVGQRHQFLVGRAVNPGPGNSAGVCLAPGSEPSQTRTGGDSSGRN